MLYIAVVMIMKKMALMMVCGIVMMSGVSMAGYTSYSNTTGYTQPRYRYVPFYHGNRDYRYEQDERVYDADIRYDTNRYRTNNTPSSYAIQADTISINNHHYGWMGLGVLSTGDTSNLLHSQAAGEGCQTKKYTARGDTYFRDLGLKIPSSLESIRRYRVRRSDGGRSQRYVVGQDVDDSHVTSGRDIYQKPVRMWSHFGTYEHEMVVCDAKVAHTYQQNNYYYPSSIYHHTLYSAGLSAPYRTQYKTTPRPPQMIIQNSFNTYNNSHNTTTTNTTESSTKHSHKNTSAKKQQKKKRTIKTYPTTGTFVEYEGTSNKKQNNQTKKQAPSNTTTGTFVEYEGTSNKKQNNQTKKQAPSNTSVGSFTQYTYPSQSSHQGQMGDRINTADTNQNTTGTFVQYQ